MKLKEELLSSASFNYLNSKRIFNSYNPTPILLTIEDLKLEAAIKLFPSTDLNDSKFNDIFKIFNKNFKKYCFSTYKSKISRQTGFPTATFVTF